MSLRAVKTFVFGGEKSKMQTEQPASGKKVKEKAKGTAIIQGKSVPEESDTEDEVPGAPIQWEVVPSQPTGVTTSVPGMMPATPTTILPTAVVAATPGIESAQPGMMPAATPAVVATTPGVESAQPQTPTTILPTAVAATPSVESAQPQTPAQQAPTLTPENQGAGAISPPPPPAVQDDDDVAEETGTEGDTTTEAYSTMFGVGLAAPTREQQPTAARTFYGSGVTLPSAALRMLKTRGITAPQTVPFASWSPDAASVAPFIATYVDECYTKGTVLLEDDVPAANKIFQFCYASYLFFGAGRAVLLGCDLKPQTGARRTTIGDKRHMDVCMAENVVTPTGHRTIHSKGIVLEKKYCALLSTPAKVAGDNGTFVAATEDGAAAFSPNGLHLSVPTWMIPGNKNALVVSLANDKTVSKARIAARTYALALALQRGVPGTQATIPYLGKIRVIFPSAVTPTIYGAIVGLPGVRRVAPCDNAIAGACRRSYGITPPKPAKQGQKAKVATKLVFQSMAGFLLPEHWGAILAAVQPYSPKNAKWHGTWGQISVLLDDPSKFHGLVLGNVHVTVETPAVMEGTPCDTVKAAFFAAAAARSTPHCFGAPPRTYADATAGTTSSAAAAGMVPAQSAAPPPG